MVANGVSPFSPDPAAMIRLGGRLPAAHSVGRDLAALHLHVRACWGDPSGHEHAGPLEPGRVCRADVRQPGLSLLYLLSGLAGSFASVVWNPAGVSAGASGAIFGVAGAMLAGTWKLRRSLPPAFLRSAKWLAVNVLVLFVVFTVVNQFHRMIDNSAHFGGFLTGILLRAGSGRADPQSGPVP